MTESAGSFSILQSRGAGEACTERPKRKSGKHGEVWSLTLHGFNDARNLKSTLNHPSNPLKICLDNLDIQLFCNYPCFAKFGAFFSCRLRGFFSQKGEAQRLREL